MFTDPPFILDNFGPEVRTTPGIVASDLQVEFVNIGQGRNRKQAASEAQQGDAAEKRVETPPRLLLEISRSFRSRALPVPATLHDDEDNNCRNKWLNAVPASNQAGQFVVFSFHVNRRR